MLQCGYYLHNSPSSDTVSVPDIDRSFKGSINNIYDVEEFFNIAQYSQMATGKEGVKTELDTVISTMSNAFPGPIDSQISSTSLAPLNRIPTLEQEQYVQGFDEALQKIHLKERLKSESVTFIPDDIEDTLPPLSASDFSSAKHFEFQGPVRSHLEPNPMNDMIVNSYFMSPKSPVSRSKSCNYLSYCYSGQSAIKSESEMLSPSIPYPDMIYPIPGFPCVTDMEEQEQLKKERKRYRNRQAASKCRRKRLEREAKMEDDVKSRSDKFRELFSRKELLQKEILELQEDLSAHAIHGCCVGNIQTSADDTDIDTIEQSNIKTDSAH